MSGTRQPDDLAALAEKQQLAGRHHAALDSLRPYFVGRDLDPAGASCFVRLSLDVSRACARWVSPKPRPVCGQ